MSQEGKQALNPCRYRFDFHGGIKTNTTMPAKCDSREYVYQSLWMSMDIERQGDGTARLVIEMNMKLDTIADRQP